MNLLKKGANKIAIALGMRWLLGQVRAVAEGKHGKGAQNAYLWTIGRKRYWSLILGLVATVLLGLGLDDAAIAVGSAAGVLLSLGFIDASWRSAGAPPWLRELDWYRWLEAHAELVTGLFALVGGTGGLLEACIDPSCDRAAKVLLALAAIGVHIGLIPQSWRARPPQVDFAGMTINAADALEVASMLEARRAGRGRG